MGVRKIVTRVNKRENVALFERVGIDAPLNPMVTALNVVLNSLQEGGHKLLATVEDGKAAILEMDVPDGFPPTEVKDLPRIPGSLIVAVTRGDRTIVPHGDDSIESGDRLLIFAIESAHPELDKLF